MRAFNVLLPFIIPQNDPPPLSLFPLRGGSSSSLQQPSNKDGDGDAATYGRISPDEFRLTPELIETFHRDGCVTVPNVLTEEEVLELEQVFNRFVVGEIEVPGHDFCDISQGFDVARDQFRIVNCMLPTTYYPPLAGNIYERLTQSIARQLFPQHNMTKDYDQFLTKRPNQTKAIFQWHQDMAYWPGPKALGGVEATETCTFSLAIDDSSAVNGCLRYIPGSGVAKKLRSHDPLSGSRDDGHALKLAVDETTENITMAPASRGSLTIHDEWVVHGSGGNHHPTSQRRTYVVAYRPEEVVKAERAIGFTHSHNDKVNWDTFQDGESHRVAADDTGK